MAPSALVTDGLRDKAKFKMVSREYAGSGVTGESGGEGSAAGPGVGFESARQSNAPKTQAAVACPCPAQVPFCGFEFQTDRDRRRCVIMTFLPPQHPESSAYAPIHDAVPFVSNKQRNTFSFIKSIACPDGSWRGKMVMDAGAMAPSKAQCVVWERYPDDSR